MEYFYPTGSLSAGRREFVFPGEMKLNTFSLSGEWNIRPEDAIAGAQAQLRYRFYADKVYLVLHPGPMHSLQTIKVVLDGQAIGALQSGSDVRNSVVTLDSDRLYNLVDLHGKSGAHTLLLQFETPGVEAYAFTFG